MQKDPTKILKDDFVSNTQVFLLCAKTTLAYFYVMDPSLYAYYELYNYQNCASLENNHNRLVTSHMIFHDDWGSRVHPFDDIMRDQRSGELSIVSFSISYIGIRTIDIKEGSWGCTGGV